MLIVCLCVRLFFAMSLILLGARLPLQMFGNNTPTPAWNEFLDFLGERILMDGWRKYAGDLDRSGASGKESLFTHWYDFQVILQ